MIYIKDVLAALSVILNCLPSAVLAMSMGFLSLSTAIGFTVGAAGLLATNQVAIISFQPETLLLLQKLSNDEKERFTIAMTSSSVVFVLGITGMLTRIIALIGEGAVFSLLAGMGIMVCKVALDMLQGERRIGLVSIVSAVAVYWLTRDLVYTCVISCTVSVLFCRFFCKGRENGQAVQKLEKPRLIRPVFNGTVLKGALSVIAMQIAAMIAYSTVNNGLAGVQGDLDSVSGVLGLSSLVSSALSGSPLAPVISATASAPHPVLSGIIFMLLMAVMLVLNMLPKLFRLIPQQAICGFLFVLGALVIFPGNAVQAVNISAIAAGLTILVSAFTDPFMGLVVGAVAFRLAALLA